MIMIAKIIVALGSGYLITGLAVGLAFLVFRIEKHDPAASGAYAFRPLLLPGLALLWPLVLLRWSLPRSTETAVTVLRHKRAHRMIWAGLVVFIIVTLGFAASIRSAKLPEYPSLRLSLTLGSVV